MKFKYRYFFVENPNGEKLEAMKDVFNQMPVSINIYSEPKYNFNLERYTYGAVLSGYLLSIETMARFNLVSDPINYLRCNMVKGR